MSRGGFWEPIAALLGALVLAVVTAWWWLAVLEPPRAPVPGHRGAAFEPISAAMPQIREYREFNVNNDNPFVPWREREVERKRLQQPSGPTVVQPPRPPPKIEVTKPPELVLPRARQGGGDAPRVGGFTRRPDGGYTVQVTLPGETRALLMSPGEKAGRWTFVTVEDGNVALFKDEGGREFRLVIGLGR